MQARPFPTPVTPDFVSPVAVARARRRILMLGVILSVTLTIAAGALFTAARIQTLENKIDAQRQELATARARISSDSAVLAKLRAYQQCVDARSSLFFGGLVPWLVNLDNAEANKSTLSPAEYDAIRLNAYADFRPIVKRASTMTKCKNV